MQRSNKTTVRPTLKAFEGIPYEVIRRRVKYSRVEFKRDRLRVIVPRGVDPLRVLEDNRDVILKKHYRLMNQIETAHRIPMTEWSEEEFLDLIRYYVEKYSRELNVETNNIKFRKMKRRWGSCRNDGVITLNVYLMYVPEHLVSYIIYHELAHLIVQGHGKEFKAIIKQEFPNYRKLDEELNLYGLKLLS